MALINLKQINGGTQLKETAEAAKTAAQQAQSEIDALEAVVGGVESEIDALQTQITEDINGLKQADSDLSGRLDVVEGQIGSHTHEADEIIESEQKQFVSAAKKQQYDENTIYNNNMATVSSLGGIAAGTKFENMPVNELLTKLLYPYIAPTVSASTLPNNGGTFEKGSTKEVTTIRATVGKKSENIKKVEYFDGEELLGTKEEAEVKNGGTFDLSVSRSVTANKQYTVKVTDAASKTYSASTGLYNFVYPYYTGVCADDATIDATLVKGLTKKVEAKGNKTVAYTCDFQRMIFAYPKSYGKLKSIIDPNNFDVTGTFGVQELQIEGLDGTPQAYYVYVNSASTVAGFNMKFNY